MDEHHRTYGVNVKVYKCPEVPGMREKLTETEIGRVWDALTFDFWTTLTEGAKNLLGLETVYSQGRSGGWAVPEPEIDPEEESERFSEFKNLCEEELQYHLDSLWPEAIAEAIENKEEKQELERRQSHYQMTITWNLSETGNKPILKPVWLDQVLTEALHGHGIQNFAIEFEEKE